MSTSVVHLALAAVAGLTLGAGATLAVQRPAVASKPDDNLPPSPTPPRYEQGRPIPLPGYATLPASGDLASRVLVPSSIGPISDFLHRSAYTTAYDRRNRIPAWTAEHLTAARMKIRDGDRANSVFKEDLEIPQRWRARLEDYFKSGYDRGHMVPAADAKISQGAMSETFLLSNIAPQVGEGFNRHYWAYLESFCRGLTNSFEDVFIFTVPLFLPKLETDGKWRVSYEMIGENNLKPSIAVPTHFAKVILASRPPTTRATPFGTTTTAITATDNKEWSIASFVLPNTPIPDQAKLESFIVPVEAVENASGLSLVPDGMKGNARHLCQSVKCEVVVRRFDDAQKLISGSKGKNGRPELKRSQTL